MKSTTPIPEPMLGNPPSASVPTDRWIFWPAVTALTTFAVLTFLCGMPGTLSFMLIPLSALGYLVAAATIILFVCVLVARGRLRKALSTALALVLPILFSIPINWVTDCLHLALMLECGVGQLGHATATNGQQFAAYDWSTGLAGGPNTFVIHDETDEIVLPLARHKRTASLENGFEEACAGKVRHLVGHYYICII